MHNNRRLGSYLHAFADEESEFRARKDGSDSFCAKVVLQFFVIFRH